MKWRVVLEMVGPDGIVGLHEIGGRATVAEYTPRLIGLTLEEGKDLLTMLQVHLVQAQAADHCRHQRRCLRCGALRPLNIGGVQTAGRGWRDNGSRPHDGASTQSDQDQGGE
ncbi:MAG TPA: hypothetical protein VHX39_10105 [Acetobacteraceae bacterium]|jgi:hypothetical protein|nr:hypothetical protein [Acetobacteraceae bacterium]